jgi:hypothetical protein
MSNEEFFEKYPHLREFIPFLGSLNKESHRGRTLISTGYLEELLGRVLQSFFIQIPRARLLVEGGNAPLGTFRSRIDACYVMGLISEDEHYDLHLIRKIRNEFAHNIDATFELDAITDRCRLLRHRAGDYTSEEQGDVRLQPSGQFTSATVNIILHLVNRAHYVSQERCEYKTWEY